MSTEDFKAAFLTAIRSGGSERERAFRFFEEKLTDSFKGEAGIKFYLDFMALVKEADESAVPDARKRFYPLIDEKLLGRELVGAFGDALAEELAEKQRGLLAKGGKEAIDYFLTYTTDVAADRDQLRKWIALAMDTMPALERNTVVELMVVGALAKR